MRSLPAAWPLLQYPLRAVSLAAVAPISEARVWSQARVVFPASRTITSMHRRAWRCATACWQADEGAHLHLGQGLLLQFSLTRQPLLHRFQIVHAHSLASRALLLFFVRCCCPLRVQRHTKKDEQKGERRHCRERGKHRESKGQQQARGNGGTHCSWSSRFLPWLLAAALPMPRNVLLFSAPPARAQASHTPRAQTSADPCSRRPPVLLSAGAGECCASLCTHCQQAVGRSPCANCLSRG